MQYDDNLMDKFGTAGRRRDSNKPTYLFLIISPVIIGGAGAGSPHIWTGGRKALAGGFGWTVHK